LAESVKLSSGNGSAGIRRHSIGEGCVLDEEHRIAQSESFRIHQTRDDRPGPSVQLIGKNIEECRTPGIPSVAVVVSGQKKQWIRSFKERFEKLSGGVEFSGQPEGCEIAGKQQTIEGFPIEIRAEKRKLFTVIGKLFFPKKIIQAAEKPLGAEHFVQSHFPGRKAEVNIRKVTDLHKRARMGAFAKKDCWSQKQRWSRISEEGVLLRGAQTVAKAARQAISFEKIALARSQ